jgi:small subunit ribosomal protein S3
MGQKVNPNSFRLPITKDWQSKWFGKNDYAKNISEDLEIRRTINNKFNKSAGISKIEILRDHEKVTININTSKPGVMIGRSGQGINDLKSFILKNVPSYKVRQLNELPKLKLEIIEVKNSESNAQLVSENIALQLEKRIAYKRAIKQAIQKAMEQKIKGIKIQISGRLNGAEIARSEKYGESSVPLGRLKANIDYGYAVSFTTYGTIGVKTWIYKNDKLVEGKE